jgi:hypothetical protein
MKRRLILLLCPALLGVAALAGIAATPAHAAGITDVTCAGTESASITPGLLLGQRPVTITSSNIMSPCVSTDPTLTAGLSTVTLHEVSSCLGIGNASNGIAEIVWNNNQASTFAYNATVSNPLGEEVVTLTGTITFGEFTGATAVMVITSATLNVLACLVPPGVTNTSGLVAVDITGL